MWPSGVTNSVPRGPGVESSGLPPTADTRRVTPPPTRDQLFLGKYRLVRPLGEGSNALVFLAQRADNPGELVVVKRIKDHVLAGPRFRQFFDNEVRSMAHFHHPYAVKLIDASLDDPMGAGLVIEYIPGITLEALLARRGRLGVARAVRLLGPLLHALQAAHAAGIVHRDLKPANLMVVDAEGPAESVRVMDFGFAGFTAKPHIQLAELTGHGQIFACGTPAYVSPEMVRGDGVDSRADLYAVGVMLYEMIAGRLPFDAATTDELLNMHINNSPPRFSRIGVTDVPAAIEGVINLCLSKYASERPATAKELCDHLSRAATYDLWQASAPKVTTESGTWDCVDLVPATPAPLPATHAPAAADDTFVLSDCFVAMMPERLAAVKLRGFIEDVKGEAISSEPGLICVRLESPPAGKSTPSGIFGWLGRDRVAVGPDAIDLSLEMQKLDANRVEVLVTFRPGPGCTPPNPPAWSARCEGYYSILRKYLMADG